MTNTREVKANLYTPGKVNRFLINHLIIILCCHGDYNDLLSWKRGQLSLERTMSTEGQSCHSGPLFCLFLKFCSFIYRHSGAGSHLLLPWRGRKQVDEHRSKVQPQPGFVAR